MANLYFDTESRMRGGSQPARGHAATLSALNTLICSDEVNDKEVPGIKWTVAAAAHGDSQKEYVCSSDGHDKDGSTPRGPDGISPAFGAAWRGRTPPPDRWSPHAHPLASQLPLQVCFAGVPQPFVPEAGRPDAATSDKGAPLRGGSFNHPHGCASPCKFARKGRVCKDGAACDHCHLCDWSRVLNRTKTRGQRAKA